MSADLTREEAQRIARRALGVLDECSLEDLVREVAAEQTDDGAAAFDAKPEPWVARRDDNELGAFTSGCPDRGERPNPWRRD
jgi:hypothetical protein